MMGCFDDFKITELSSGSSYVTLLCAAIGAILDPRKEQTPCHDIVFIGNREITHLHNDPNVSQSCRKINVLPTFRMRLTAFSILVPSVLGDWLRSEDASSTCLPVTGRLTRDPAADFCVENDDRSRCLPLPASVKRSLSWTLACISLSPCRVSPRVRHPWPSISDVLWSDTAVGKMSWLAFHPTRPPWVVWSIYGMLSCRGASPGTPRSL